MTLTLNTFQKLLSVWNSLDLNPERSLPPLFMKQWHLLLSIASPGGYCKPAASSAVSWARVSSTSPNAQAAHSDILELLHRLESSPSVLSLSLSLFFFYNHSVRNCFLFASMDCFLWTCNLVLVLFTETYISRSVPMWQSCGQTDVESFSRFSVFY